MKKNKIFGIENCFKNLNFEDDYVDLQKIEIYDQLKTAILVTDKNRNLIGSNFYNTIFNNNLNILSFFSKNNKKGPGTNYWNIEFNKNNNAFSEINFFNMAEKEEQNSQYPLVYKYEELKKNYGENKEHINQLNKTVNKYYYPVRHVILNILVEQANLLMAIFQDFERNFNSVLNKTTKNIAEYNFDELQTRFKEIESYQDLFFGEQITLILDLFSQVFNKFEFFYNASKSNIDYLGDEQINHLKKRLYYLTEMRKTSKKRVEDNLKIRDLKHDICALDEIAKEISHNSDQKIKYFAFRYKRSAEIDLYKSTFFARESSQRQILNKRYFVKMFAHKLLKKYKKYFKYLKIDELDEMRRTLDTTIKLFISNSLGNLTYSNKNFSIKKIKKILKEEFYFNVESYEIKSKSNFDLIKGLKDQTQSQIMSIKNRSYGTYFNTVPERSIKVAKEILTNAQSEHNWKFNKIQSEFYNTLKSNQKLLNSYDAMALINSKIKKKIMKLKTSLWFKRIFNRSINEKDKLNIKNFGANLKKIIEKFKMFDFVFNNVIVLKNSLVLAKKVSNKLLHKLDQFDRLIEIFEKSSINTKSLIRPYENISKINKLKMNFISSIIKKPKLIIIADDPDIKDIKLKFEFLRAAFELCEQSKINIIFVTQDKELVEDNEFDYIYLIANNKEVEFGDLKEVLNNTINPEIKSRINDQAISQEIIRSQKEFVFSDIYDVDEEHYIITPSKYFKLWMQGHKNENNSLLVTDELSQEKTIETQINDLENPLLEKTVMIAAFQPNKIKNSKNLDKTFTQELEAIQKIINSNQKVETDLTMTQVLSDDIY